MQSANRRSNNRRRTASVIAVVLALAILLTGTFAWQSLGQWALNQVIALPGLGGGRLHDDFEVMGENFGMYTWRAGRAANKDIYVENFELTGVAAGRNIYVRIRLYEYIEIGEGAQLHPDHPGFATRAAQPLIPYAPDGRPTDREDRTTWAPRVPEGSTWNSQATENSNEFREFWQWTMGGQKYFMPTFNRDHYSLMSDVKGDAVDPQHAARVAASEPPNPTMRDDDPATIFDFPPQAGLHDFFDPANPSGITDFTSDGEATWTSPMKYWDTEADGGNGEHAITDDPVTHEARQTLYGEFMLLEEWLELPVALQTGPYWVMHDDGWSYWAQPLQPSEATGLLLDQITLLQTPEDEMYYAIFANAEMSLFNDWFEEEETAAWRVLTEDANGNRLIITEHIHGIGTAYNTTNTYTRLNYSDTLRSALNDWFENIPDRLRQYAVPAANLNNDVRLLPFGAGSGWASENAPSGWTSVDSVNTIAPTAENILFILTISEVNRYFGVGALNVAATDSDGIGRYWWLRSPSANDLYPAAVSPLMGMIVSGRSATAEAIGFRPAMWVAPGSLADNVAFGETFMDSALSSPPPLAPPTANPAAEAPIGGTFTDSMDVEWRVLTTDSNGNRLIITDRTSASSAPYHLAENVHTTLSESDTLRAVLSNWYFDALAPEIRLRARPAENVDGNFTNAGSGTATAENALFVLSAAEVDRFSEDGTINKITTDPGGTIRPWWLRSSSGNVASPVHIVNASGNIVGSTSTHLLNRFRPALWVGP